MKLRFFETDLSVCLVMDLTDVDMSSDLFFLAKTPDELSLVCPTDSVPERVIKTESGWRCFRVEGVLDFSLIGILSAITRILALNKISVFAVSTFTTDYILIKHIHVALARQILAAAGYEIIDSVEDRQ